MESEEEKVQIPDSLDTSVKGEPAVELPTQQQAAFPDGGARAWLVAAGAAGVLFSTFGYANAFGVYQEYYQTNQLRNESPSAISWIGSLQVFFLLSGNLFGGPLFDRFGAKVIWPPAMLYLLSVMMTSLCKEYYQFLLAQGILGGLSMGMVIGPALASTGQYFNKNRGAAMGIAVGGSSLGGVIFPIALSKMLSNPTLGFGWTVRILGFLMLAVLVLSCTAIRARLPPRKGRFFLPSAFKNIQFLGVLISVSLMLLGVFMPFFYLPTYAVSRGMSTQLASYVISILNAASFFGRVIPGVLGDKLGRYNALAAAGLGSGILIFCMPKTSSNAAIIVFAALYGFTSGAIVSGMTVVLSQVPKAPRDIGTYLGMGMGVVSIAALIGPPIDGVFVSHYHGFSELCFFSGAVVLAGGLMTIFMKSTTEKGIFGKI
jgi:MFS family permease